MLEKEEDDDTEKYICHIVTCITFRLIFNLEEQKNGIKGLDSVDLTYVFILISLVLYTTLKI